MAGYLDPDMRQNRYEHETGERCEVCQDAEPDLALLARIARAPDAENARRGRGLTATQRAALVPYARGYSYRTIGSFLGLLDITVIGRVRAGLDVLKRIDAERTAAETVATLAAPVAPRVPDDPTTPKGFADAVDELVRSRGGYLSYSDWFEAFGDPPDVPDGFDWDAHNDAIRARGLVDVNVREDTAPRFFAELMEFGFKPSEYEDDDGLTRGYFEGYVAKDAQRWEIDDLAPVAAAVELLIRSGGWMPADFIVQSFSGIDLAELAAMPGVETDADGKVYSYRNEAA